MEQAVRQLGQALAGNCLAISKLRGWKGSAKEESHKVVELSRQVDGLQHEMAKLHQEQEDSRALLTEKSKEALDLSNKIAELQAEVEKLKEEPAKRGEELVHKDKKLEKVKEVLTDDVANSYMTGFEDVVAQASGIYPEMDFSQLGLGNTVVDG